jgi:gas vesicle protein
MALLNKRQKKEAKKRLARLEKRLGQKIDLKELEKRVGGRIDLKELEKKLDLKELEKRLPRRHEEPESSSAGFIAGLVVGAIIGAVLAMLFGKSSNREVMDQFAHRAESLKDTAAEKYHQARGDTADQAETVVSQFGDDPAIEREINGDLVDSAADTIDSASEDVQQAVDEVAEGGEKAKRDLSEM